MKDSIKANLIVFSIIALISFGLSNAFFSSTTHETNDSYKLKALENNSFTPAFVDEVPTIIPEPKNTTNKTNSTNGNIKNTTNTSTNQTNLTDILKPLGDAL